MRNKGVEGVEHDGLLGTTTNSVRMVKPRLEMVVLLLIVRQGSLGLQWRGLCARPTAMRMWLDSRVERKARGWWWRCC